MSLRTAPATRKSEPVSELSQAKDSRETTRAGLLAARPRKGDPRFGPVCECGRAKAKQAATCQACHGRHRGYKASTKQEIDRRARLRYMGQLAPVGDEDAALIVRADRLNAAPAADYDRELTALIAEQARDERLTTFARDRWMLSLDDVDQYGRPLYEVIAA